MGRVEEYAKVLRVICLGEVGSHGIGVCHDESWMQLAATTLAATRWKRLETTLGCSNSLSGHLWQIILLYTRRVSFTLSYSVHRHVNGNSGRRSGKYLDRLRNMYNVLRPVTSSPKALLRYHNVGPLFIILSFRLLVFLVRYHVLLLDVFPLSLYSMSV